jgi:CcmD family protein
MDTNYIVMIVVLIIWTGLFLYVYSVDRKIKRVGGDDEN